MNINNLFFHIHYCKSRKSNDSKNRLQKITRTIQHHELLFVIEGYGSITINEKKYQIKKGMLFYISPDVLHSIEIDAQAPIWFYSVHFSYAHASFNDNKWTIKDGTEVLPLQFAQELRDFYQIDDIFKKLVESWNAKQPGYEFVTKTLLQQLLIAIFQNLRKQNQNYSTSLKVEKIIEHMHQNINKQITLAELSDIVKLSPTYLSRTFKDITGYSVIEFFNKLKIDKAKGLFIDGNKKIKEVAQTVGFTDEFYFSRVFKKIEGVSPTEFYSKNIHQV